MCSKEGFAGFLLVLLSSARFRWGILGSAGFHWIPLDSTEFLWIPLGSIGFRWVPLGFIKFCQVPLSSSGFRQVFVLICSQYLGNKPHCQFTASIWGTRFIANSQLVFGGTCFLSGLESEDIRTFFCIITSHISTIWAFKKRAIQTTRLHSTTFYLCDAFDLSTKCQKVPQWHSTFASQAIVVSKLGFFSQNFH